LRCAANSADAIWLVRSQTRASDSGASRAMTSARIAPSRYSMTMNGGPSGGV
jgi:hypothetical protein